MAVSSPAAHGHASLGPSSAARWTACPGSVRRCAGVHSPDTLASLRGTRAHSIAEMALLLEFRTPVHEWVDTWVQMVADWRSEYPDAEDFDELCEVALEYVEVVRDLVHSLGPDASLLIEERVRVPGTQDQVWGTSDAIVYSRRHHVLHVLDLKAGKGVRVVAKGNLQLRLYALGALERVDPSGYSITDVYTHIVQPARDGHTSEHYSARDLLVFEGWIGARVSEALADDAPVRPGDAQCRWCPVRQSCREYLDWQVQDWFGTAGVPPADPEPRLPAFELAYHLDMRDRAKRYVRAVDAAAEAADTVPDGWEVRTTRRSRVAKPAKLAEALRQYGYEPFETRLKPITQMKQDLGAAWDLLAHDFLEYRESSTVRRTHE